MSLPCVHISLGSSTFVSYPLSLARSCYLNRPPSTHPPLTLFLRASIPASPSPSHIDARANTPFPERRMCAKQSVTCYTRPRICRCVPRAYPRHFMLPKSAGARVLPQQGRGRSRSHLRRATHTRGRRGAGTCADDGVIICPAATLPAKSSALVPPSPLGSPMHG